MLQCTDVLIISRDLLYRKFAVFCQKLQLSTTPMGPSYTVVVVIVVVVVVVVVCSGSRPVCCRCCYYSNNEAGIHGAAT